MSEESLNFKPSRILVVGDIMLDRYVKGVVRRISPEAPVPVVQVKNDQNLLGGAANVANNLVSIGVETHVLGVIGADEGGQTLLSLLEKQGVDTNLVEMIPNRMTTIKTRIVGGQQQIVRVDRETAGHLSMEEEDGILCALKERWNDYDGIILSDYGKGLLSESFLDRIRGFHTSNPKIVSVDPKDRSFMKYRDFTICTPNRLEAQTATGSELENDEVILKEGILLRERINLDALLITLGSRGMALFEQEGSTRIQTEAREVFDVTGAGDTVISVITACLCMGMSYERAARVANGAAGIVVGKLGAATISRKELECIIGQFE